MQRPIAILLLLCLSILSAFSSAAACPDIDGLVDLNCDQQLIIVCFGDSITFGRQDALEIGYPGRLATLLPNAVVVNLGVPGEKTPFGRSRAARQFAAFSNADYVIVLEGVNDFFLEEPSAANTRNNLLGMIASAKNIGAATLLGNLTAIRRSNQKGWISSVNSQINPHRQINFFSLGEGIIGSDLIHPDAEGYDQMTTLVSQTLPIISSANRPVDADADGIYDFAEPRFGTSTLSADTDLDGLTDGAEVFTHGSSPLLIDSDADGLSDLQEVSVGANPSDPRPSSPTLQTLEVLAP